MSDIRGKAENICSQRVFQLLTQLGSRVCIATIQTMMIYSIVFGAPRQLQSLAGLEHGRTILLADTARNLGFICPRSARTVAADNPMLAPSESLSAWYQHLPRFTGKQSASSTKIPTVVRSVLIKINENLSNAAYPNKSPPPQMEKTICQRKLRSTTRKRRNI